MVILAVSEEVQSLADITPGMKEPELRKSLPDSQVLFLIQRAVSASVSCHWPCR